jgi:quercetin 2,3-dioxygenase
MKNDETVQVGTDAREVSSSSNAVDGKKLLHLLQSSETHWVGNGFPVRSVFSYSTMGRELSPFLLLDYAAPYRFSPGNERRGVGAHPHKGFETVTIAYQGELEHRDSSGGGGKIGSGDVQWMTAGRGIVHEEFHSADFTRKGGTLEMVQLWVNLPARFKNADPGYQTLFNADIPDVPIANNAGSVRVIAGEYAGRKGPARTFTPINLLDIDIRSGKAAEFTLRNGHTAAVLVLKGKVRLNNRDAVGGDLGIFSRDGSSIAVSASTDATVLLMSGEPIDEPIVGRGPFVMNTLKEIQQAFEDYQLGRMGELLN